MYLRNTASEYGAVAKWFHWTSFFLLLFMMLFGYLLANDFFPDHLESSLKNIHKLIGLLVLMLIVLRMLWALTNPKPCLHQAPAWQYAIERSVHFLLYALSMAIPLVGWIGSSAAGRPPYLGALIFSLPLDINKLIAKTAFSMHYFLSLLLIGLFGLHLLGALYHHFICKDQVLTGMLPRTRK